MVAWCYTYLPTVLHLRNEVITMTLREVEDMYVCMYVCMWSPGGWGGWGEGKFPHVAIFYYDTHFIAAARKGMYGTAPTLLLLWIFRIVKLKTMTLWCCI